MAQLYADENFPQPVVEQLRELGHGVLTTSESGKAGQKLPMKKCYYLRSDNRILLTLNRKHFIRLHNDHPAHAGIIVCTFDPDFRSKHVVFIPLYLTKRIFRGACTRKSTSPIIQLAFRYSIGAGSALVLRQLNRAFAAPSNYTTAHPHSLRGKSACPIGILTVKTVCTFGVLLTSYSPVRLDNPLSNRKPQPRAACIGGVRAREVSA